MKRILGLSFFLAVFITTIYSQNEEAGKELFEFCVDQIGDLHAVIYLYKTDYAEEKVTLEKLKNYAAAKQLNILFNEMDDLYVGEDSTGRIEISYRLNCDEGPYELDNTVWIQNVKCKIILDPPVSAGSSMRSVSGKIVKGVLIKNGNENVVIENFESKGDLIIRVDISELQRLKVKLENNLEAGSPEWVMTEFFNKFSLGEIEKAVDLIDVEDMGQLKAVFREVILLDTSNALIKIFCPGTEDVGEFDKLPENKFMSGFLATALKYNPDLLANNLGVKQKFLGRVFETDDLVHLVMKNTTAIGEDDISIIEVRTLRKDEDKWYVIIPSDVKLSIYVLKQKLLIGDDSE